MNWINTKCELPKEGEYVLAKHNRGTWGTYKNVNCVVVKLVKGLSKKDRKLMENGKLPSEKTKGINYNGNCKIPIVTWVKRYDVFKFGDEANNNELPYAWEGYGNSFNGQEITQWTHIK